MTDNGKASFIEPPGEAPPIGSVRVTQGFGQFLQTVPEGSPAAKYRLRVPDNRRLPNEVWVNMGAGGMGDTLLGLCATKGYKLDHPDKLLVYRFNERNLRYVMMFDGYDGISTHQFDHTVNDFPPPDQFGNLCDARDLQLNAGYQLELSSKGQITRIQRYCRNLGYCTPALPRLREPAKLAAAAGPNIGCVVLAPFAASADRSYPLHGWVHIENALHAAGYDTLITGTKNGPVVIGTDFVRYGQPIEPERLEVKTTRFKGRVVMDPEPECLAGIMLTAKCVIGNDSGIAHLAGILGTPTIVLCGWSEGDKIYDFYPSVLSMQGTYACNGCWTKTQDYDDQRCNRMCANLASIDPASVVREVMARVPIPPKQIAIGHSPVVG